MFLANENFPKPSVEWLQKSGFGVTAIQEVAPGVSDEEVMAKALRENLIILTFDKDYGEIIFQHSYPDPPAVVFFREKGHEPMFAGRLLLSLLEEGFQLQKAFTVVEERNIRQRFYRQ